MQKSLGTKPWYLPFLSVFALRNGRTIVATFFFTLLMIAIATFATFTGLAISNQEDEETTYKVSLDEGWNMVSLPIGPQEEDTDKTLTLNKGWNLIGYSSRASPKTSLAKKVKIDNQRFSDAVKSGIIQNQFAFYDSKSQKYSLAPLKSSTLNADKGYWVYANKNNAKLTLEGVGGSEMNASIPVSELTFKRSTTGEEKTGWTNAINAGWITEGHIWLSEEEDFIRIDSQDKINSWQGFFIETRYPDIEIVV